MARKDSAGELRLEAVLVALMSDLESKDRQGPHGFAIQRLKNRMRKRAAFHRPQLREEAVQKFKSLNSALKDYECNLDPEVLANARHYITVMCERFTKSLVPDCIQQPLSWNVLFDLWKYGPGASNGTKGTHTCHKIVQDMTCTKSAIPAVLMLRKLNTYFSRFDAENKNVGITEVAGSRLTTVLKNEDEERTIGIEPSGNMVLQLAEGQYLEGVLRFIGLDISTQQPKNKAMAKRGSIDGSVATLDLVSASNMFHVNLIRALYPKEHFDLMMTLRSPEVEYPDGSKEQLHMMSTMGNGFTFPMMTLSLVALLYGFRATRGGPNLFMDWSSTCVFGDDIIIPKDEYEGFTKVLTDAGLVVNHDKSYFEGPFRESCGGDYFEGVDVTPFYVRSLSNDPSIYVVLNQVMEWSAKHNCFLPQTVALVRSYVRNGLYLVPEWHGSSEGFRTAQCSRRYKYLRPVREETKVRDDHPFLYPLACGGYIRSNGHHMFFTPRPYRNEVRVKSARLPNGYLDGSAPEYREQTISDYISSYTFFVR